VEIGVCRSKKGGWRCTFAHHVDAARTGGLHVLRAAARVTICSRRQCKKRIKIKVVEWKCAPNWTSAETSTERSCASAATPGRVCGTPSNFPTNCALLKPFSITEDSCALVTSTEAATFPKSRAPRELSPGDRETCQVRGVRRRESG
jgi:hypothetical protein